jgi:hypothetical protein
MFFPLLILAIIMGVIIVRLDEPTWLKSLMMLGLVMVVVLAGLHDLGFA